MDEIQSKRLKIDTTNDGEWAANIIRQFYLLPGVWEYIKKCIPQKVVLRPNQEISLAFIETFLNTNRIGMQAKDNEVYKAIHKNIKLIQYVFLNGKFDSLPLRDKFEVLELCGFNYTYLVSSSLQ